MAKTMARFTYDSDTAQAVAAGSSIQFTSTTESDQLIGYDNAGGIKVKAPGTYLVTASITTVATATGSVEVQMMENGTYAAGARAEGTVAAVGDFVTLAISDLVTVRPGSNGSYATLTFAPVEATSIQTANVLVIRVS